MNNIGYCCSWCQQGQCNCSQFNERHCAGPYQLTGEDQIGDRECCNGLKKCSDPAGLKQWCSTTGKCPDDDSRPGDCPPTSQAYADYSQVIVPKEHEKFGFGDLPFSDYAQQGYQWVRQEHFNEGNTALPGRRGTYSRMKSL